MMIIQLSIVLKRNASRFENQMKDLAEIMESYYKIKDETFKLIDEIIWQI
mgnify:CR=1 FL=1|jgi:hypothetical protein